MNSSPQHYVIIAFILATAVVFSAALMFQYFSVLEDANAQNDSSSTISRLDNSSGSQENMPGAAEAQTFIVTLKNQSSSADLNDIIKTVEEKGGNVTHVYNYSISGFSVQIPPQMEKQTTASLKNDRRVSSVEPDQTMTLPSPLS